MTLGCSFLSVLKDFLDIQRLDFLEERLNHAVLRRVSTSLQTKPLKLLSEPLDGWESSVYTKTIVVKSDPLLSANLIPQLIKPSIVGLSIEVRLQDVVVD